MYVIVWPTSCLFCIHQRWLTLLSIRSVSRAWSSIFNPHVFKSLNQRPKISCDDAFTAVSNTLNHIMYIPKMMSYRPTPTAISHQLFLNPKETNASWHGSWNWHVCCWCAAGCLRMWKREADFALWASVVGFWRRCPFARNRGSDQTQTEMNPFRLWLQVICYHFGPEINPLNPDIWNNSLENLIFWNGTIY